MRGLGPFEEALGLRGVEAEGLRARFGGGELPERARVLRVVPRDGDDVLAGDPLLELAPS